MKPTALSVANDFSRTPGSRYSDEGDHSGEAFRKEVLQPAISIAVKASGKLTIDLDGTAGYGTSFLEEAFGGLVRESGYTAVELTNVINFKSDEEPYLIEDIKGYINDAATAAQIK